MNAGTKPFVVVCPRQDGRLREFQRYAIEAEAERVAEQLRAVGCAARVALAAELKQESRA